MKTQTIIQSPFIGQKIYVPTALYLSHGKDDFEGGIATINKIEESHILPSSDFNYLMVGIQEEPGVMYNWKYLVEEQEKWKKIYGDQIAHSNPDDRPEFNNFFND